MNILLAAYTVPPPAPQFDATGPFLLGLFVILAILVWTRRTSTSD